LPELNLALLTKTQPDNPRKMKPLTHAEMSARGGKSTASKMTPAQLKARAEKGAAARWKEKGRIDREGKAPIIEGKLS
jgi:hypothetical protein